MKNIAMRNITENYRWNFVVNSVNEAFWILSNNLASIITLLPVFIEKLGASNTIVGIVPGIAFLCIMLPGIISANTFENKRNILHTIKRLTILQRAPFFVMTLSAFFLAIPFPKITISISLLCVILIFSVSGFIQPGWYGYIAKVTPARKLGTYFSTSNGLGALLGIGGFALAAYLLDAYPFPYNYFWIFFYASVAVSISFFFLLLGREPNIPEKKIATPSVDFFKSLPKVLSSDKPFTHFIIVRNLQCLGSMATTFFTIYAIKSLHFETSSAGILSIFLASSQSFFFFIWGYVGDQKGHKLVLIIASLGLISTSIVLLFFNSWMAICSVFVFLGIYYSGIGCSGLALLHQMAPKGRYPTYVALYNTLQVVSAFIAPVLGGWLVDIFNWEILFIVASFFSTIGFIWLVLLVKEKRGLDVSTNTCS